MAGSSTSPPGQIISFSARTIGIAHTTLALLAFLSSLLVGSYLHYKKLVKNGIAGYPQEWLPSVSATIGDWYPERNIFQILIAITSGPRFALVFLRYFLLKKTSSSNKWSGFFLWVGIVRTLACGGWVYITSTDDHDAHDILMILYIVCNIPWMLGSMVFTPSANSRARIQSKRITTAFFACIPPLIYFFIQHKVHEIPGAYSIYSIFEWSLVLLDVLYDNVFVFDLADLNISVSYAPGAVRSGINESTNVVSSESKSKTNTAVSSKSKSETTKRHRDAALSTPSLNTVSFVSDIYLSYVFWSIFTSLLPSLFYFSVWKLALSGHEASLISTLSPVLLGIPEFRRFAFSHWGKVAFSFLGFAGLAAYLCVDPLLRLGVVNFANICICIRVVADWSGPDAMYHGVVFGLGLILSSISKLANHSNNPVWPFIDERSGGYNRTGLVLAFLALLELSIRSRPTAESKSEGSQIRNHSRHWLGPALAQSSLIFAVHYQLTDAGTLIAWSWTGYPIKGPLPHLHGSLTIIAQCIGLALPVLLSWSQSRVLSHPLWFVYGSIGAYVMLQYRDWFGYIGGLNFAIFLMSIMPTTLAQTAEVAKGRIGRTYFVTFVFANLLSLASVWVVAYAFVPGGVYLRERSDLVLLVQMIMLLPVFTGGLTKVAVPKSLAFPQWARSRIQTTLFIMSIVSFLVTLYRWPAEPRLFKAGGRIFNAGIWTVHFGIDEEGRDSQRRMRDLVKDMDLDVLGLLESDLHRPVYGNRDLTRLLVEEMGYYVDLGPGPNSHTWGAALLSKFPIIKSTHHLLPSPDGELAPAIEAILDVYGTEVTVVVSHNGQEETPLDRELQAKELGRIMSESYPKPVVYLGYVVTPPHARRPAPYDYLVTDGRVNDIEKDDHDRWCEYIFFRGLYRTGYARVSRDTITDTELQIGQFVVPKYGYVVANQTDETLYRRCPKEALPKEHWFPEQYYGEGQRGHFYHVFDEPLYYCLPEDAHA